ncbi:MAG: Gfo/Idh/MocA family oxidoreductase [Actinomycetota bacterium]
MSLRIGILGASRIAENAIVGPARELGHRLVAVAARDPLRARAFADKYGIERVLTSYQDLISDADVDIVYNPLANALHAPWNLAAVAAGKPVLTEKPFARDRAEAARVAQAAAAAGVTVMEGFHYLFHPVMQRVLGLFADGTLGDLQRIEVAMAMPEPAPDDPRWSLDMAGGSLMDLGCYALHIMRRFGSPTVVWAEAVQRTPGVDERFTAEFSFASGATGLTTNSMVDDEYSFTLRVAGSRAEATVANFINPRADDRVTITTAESTTVEHLGTRPSYSYQLEAFAAHVERGAALPLDLADAVANMALIDDTYRAAGMPPR